MQEEQESTVVVQPSVNESASQGETCLLKEFPFSRRSDLQGQLLGFSKGEFKTLTPEEIKAKIAAGESSQRWDFDSINQVSNQEREETKLSLDEWKEKMGAWIKNPEGGKEYKKILDELLKGLGVINEAGEINLGVLLGTFYGEGRKSNSQVFIDKIAGLPDLEEKMQVIQDLAGTLFGEKVSSQIAAQMIDLEGRIKQTNRDETKVNELVNEITEAVKTPKQETQELMEETTKLYKRSTKIGAQEEGKEVEAEDGGKGEKDIDKSVENFSESEPFPTNAGGTVIGNRGKEVLGTDVRGQDRIYYRSLSNEIEVYCDADGAGASGHLIAGRLGGLISEELSKLKPEQITPNLLQEMARQIHTRMQAEYGQTSGSTLDVVIKIPSGKKYGWHVGEGFIGNIDKDKNLIQPLVEPQNFGIDETTGEPRRTPNGYKTPTIGVDCEINPAVIELPDLPIIIASDGFGELLAQYKFDYDLLYKLLAENPQKASEYLAQVANEYVQKYCQDWNAAHPDKQIDPDDISLVIIV